MNFILIYFLFFILIFIQLLFTLVCMHYANRYVYLLVHTCVLHIYYMYICIYHFQYIYNTIFLIFKLLNIK